MINVPHQNQEARKDLLRRHREVSETIRRAMLALLTFSLFCWLTLGSPDRSLIVGDETIRVPFVEVDLSFPAFLIVAPFLLIVLLVYLHVFIEERLRLEERLRRTAVLGSGDAGRMAALFNFDHPAAHHLATFIFYWLVPLTLGAIFWKALARPEWWGLPMMAVMVTVTGTLACVQDLRSPNRVWPPRTARRVYGALAVVLFIAFLFATLAGFLHRPFNLYRAELQNVWLLGANLENADLRFANLQGAQLRDANLQGGDLGYANLSGAELWRANLGHADLNNANLRDAALVEANLSYARLVGADFSNGQFWHANLSQADLSYARLNNANLLGARLVGANLSHARLVGARLNSANLGKVKFCRTTMPDETRCNRDCDGQEDRSCSWLENR